MGNSVLETDMAWEKISLWFHLKSDWMNWLDKYEAVPGVQLFIVYQGVRKRSASLRYLVPCTIVYSKYWDQSIFLHLFFYHFRERKHGLGKNFSRENASSSSKGRVRQQDQMQSESMISSCTCYSLPSILMKSLDGALLKLQGY